MKIELIQHDIYVRITCHKSLDDYILNVASRFPILQVEHVNSPQVDKDIPLPNTELYKLIATKTQLLLHGKILTTPTFLTRDTPGGNKIKYLSSAYLQKYLFILLHM